MNGWWRATFHVLGALCLWAAAQPASGGDWPMFRGPAGDGVARGDQAPLHWGKDRNVRWKVPLPGPGNSSPIVSRGRVFVTCAAEKGTRRTLYCFDRRDGTQLWARTVEFAGVEPTHATNPSCASTPAADGQRIVVWHGSAGVFCYDFEGNELWKADLGPVRHDWGYASSPVLWRGKGILNFGPGARTFLVALDLKSGRELWRHHEPGGVGETDERMVGSWSTPVVARVDDRDQVLCAMPTRLIACDAVSGELLWWCDGLGTGRVDMVYPMPLICGDVAVAFTGWVNGPTLGVRLGGGGRGGLKGDVTASHRLWLDRQTQRVSSGVAVDGRIYISNCGPATAQCIDCKTGKALWTARLDGGESWGSVVMAGDRLYVTSRRGVTSVFRADPARFELLASNDLGERSHATPAISDGEIFLRTDGHLYCVGEQ